MTDAIHDNAAKGFSRGAEDYEAGRPSYPAEAIELIVEEFAIGPGATVVDVGAGTGKFTRLLVPTGARVIAVEPVAEMRAVFARVLPEVEVVDGTGESMPFEDGSVDVVTAAQAFHWVDADRGVREVHRVLRPGGGFAAIWNTRDESVGWTADIRVVMDEIASDTPRYRDNYAGEWRDVLEAHSGFTEVRYAQFRLDHPTTRDGTLKRVASTSYVSAMDDAARAEVLARVSEIIAPLGESFVEPYVTDLWWTTKR